MLPLVMDLINVGWALPLPSIQYSYRNFWELLSWAAEMSIFQVFSKKSDYAAFA